MHKELCETNNGSTVISRIPKQWNENAINTSIESKIDIE